MAAIQDEVQLRQLISQSESQTVELKLAPPRPAELAERMCGLANARGGWLIFGVEDGTLELRGLKDVGEATDTILRAARLCQPLMPLDPPEPQLFRLDGKNILVAGVPRSSGPIYQAGGVFWIRRGTHTVPHSLDEISEQLFNRGTLRWELSPAEGTTLEDLDPQQIEAFMARRTEAGARPSPRFRNREDVLVGLKCAIKQGDSYLPTNAGLLFFGYNPQDFILQSSVTCVLYSDELGVKPYTDRKIMRGTLPNLIQAVEDWLRRYVPTPARFDGFRRVDVPDYPPGTLREAVINAIIHRDYSRIGESVRLFYYPDRLEVHSPGLLLPGVNLELLSSGQAPSRLRNPVMAGLLRDIPGYVETIGSGVRLMIHEMREAGKPEPEFREVSEFVVTFYHSEAKGKPNPQFDTTYPAVKKVEPMEVIAGLENPAIYADQGERLKVAMRYVHEKGSISNREYRALTNVSESTGMRDLDILVGRGALRAVGQKRARRYLLA